MDQFGRAAGALIHRWALALPHGQPPAGLLFALGFGLLPLTISQRLLGVYIDGSLNPTCFQSCLPDLKTCPGLLRTVSPLPTSILPQEADLHSALTVKNNKKNKSQRPFLLLLGLWAAPGSTVDLPAQWSALCPLSSPPAWCVCHRSASLQQVGFSLVTCAPSLPHPVTTAAVWFCLTVLHFLPQCPA